MKVACIGNTNNNFFSLVRYLRDRGIGAELLLLDNEADHFHPSADTFDVDFQNYTRAVAWGSAYPLHRVPHQQIRADLKPYDALIGCSTAPAAAHFAGLRLDVEAPFGGDIYAWPFFRWTRPRHQWAALRFCLAQRAGIRAARHIVIGPTNPETEAILDRLGYRGRRHRFGIPMVYTPLYHPERIRVWYDRSRWYPGFRAVRDAYDLVVFHHARHVWKHAPDRFSWKGNDRLLRGFATFLRRTSGVRAALITFEYGSDIEASKQLARELGVAEHVHWFPRMPRKEIMVGLSLADVATGEFHHSWLICGTVYEGLALAKPLLHYREDGLYDGDFPELYPLFSVRSEEAIAGALSECHQHPDTRRAMGERGRVWFQRHAVDTAVDGYVGLLERLGR